VEPPLHTEPLEYTVLCAKPRQPQRQQQDSRCLIPLGPANPMQCRQAVPHWSPAWLHWLGNCNLKWALCPTVLGFCCFSGGCGRVRVHRSNGAIYKQKSAVAQRRLQYLARSLSSDTYLPDSLNGLAVCLFVCVKTLPSTLKAQYQSSVVFRR